MVGLAGQESGNPAARNVDTGAIGSWQVLPSNYGKWAKEAGLSADAPPTAENQRIIVRHKLVAYFEAFGSWDAVARSWYAGPGHAHTHSDVPQGKYPSINAYARSVMAKVGRLPCS